MVTCFDCQQHNANKCHSLYGLVICDRCLVHTQAYDHSRNSTAIPMQSPADVNMATPNSESHGPAANQPGCGLGDNIDVLVCRAQWYYHVGAYQVNIAAK